MEYIRNAAQEDDYRPEPAFELQASCRNIKCITEKVLPLMEPTEVWQLVLDDYLGELQTLTSGAEANGLKFKEPEQLLSPGRVLR